MDENIVINEKKYNITTEKNNKMDLYLRYYENEEISISIYLKYELKCNLEEFQKNRFFRIFNNIEELMLELDSKLEKATILEETNLLILDIPIGLKIINDILLEIKITEKNPLENYNELIQYNNKLKLKINQLENNIIEKDNKINQILNKNKELNEENKNLKEKLKKIEEEENKNKKNIFDLNESYIVKNKEKKIALKNWISENGKIKNINLLYRATRDGDSCESFYNKCGEKGITISLIKTKKNRIFGGFSTAQWTDKKGNIKLYDKTAFLFSLDDMKKYNILKLELAIGCYPEETCLVYCNCGDACGVCLKNKILKVKGNFNFLNSNNFENHKSRVYNVPSDFCLSGENYFEVEEVEVYQVIYE